MCTHVVFIYMYVHLRIYTPDNPNSVSRMPQRGHTALDLTLANDREEAEEVLRAHDTQVSLFFAAEKGMTDEIAARIAVGQDVNACNEEGRTALELALENDHTEVAEKLQAHGAHRVSLFFAAEKGMTDEIAARIATGQDVNARDLVIFLCVYTHTSHHTHISSNWPLAIL
jgi:hypothetical protein